ncbi:MAG TPA: phosphopentomutase [Candidatus Scatosoma pullicola]|nr:phosphopentomutase [Candidatus Scatosoma pullicola]
MDKKFRRVFLIVLDSFGVGEAPDAAEYGDAGSNTLRSVSESPFFRADNLAKLGLFRIEGARALPAAEQYAGVPLCGVCARLREKSRGKDTTTGHWELAGLVSEIPFPTYPHGFPEEVIAEFERRTGRGVLCNLPYSGTEVIRDYGAEHLKTGKLIVYTSADSVFQVAAHESAVPVEELYAYCRAAREILTGKNGVGRVIARPFAGEEGNFYRTSRRHDFSLPPTGETMLDLLKGAGRDVIGIGKISDIFAGRGITENLGANDGNDDGMRKAEECLKRDFSGLCFVNLVDFDEKYGHRRDRDGYAKAIARFDGWLGGFLPRLQEGDALMLTADHGCDPAFLASTDHTREYVPLLVYLPGIRCGESGTRGFSAVAGTVLDMLGLKSEDKGKSLLPLFG